MSKHYDKTSMGGGRESFQTTCWDEIEKAKTLDKSKSHKNVAEFIRKYWKPVYCYLRRKGYTNEPAKDLTQDFFNEVVLGRDLIKRADKSKGRFRTFLLTALDRFVVDVHDKERRQKRKPKGQMVPLDTEGLSDLPDLYSQLGPDQIFNHVWAIEVLNQVMARVKEDCRRDDKITHWNVFHSKVITPIVDNIEVPALKDICMRYGVEGEAKASKMIAYVKGRFNSAMTQHLRQFVSSDEEVKEERNELFEIISKK